MVSHDRRRGAGGMLARLLVLAAMLAALAAGAAGLAAPGEAVPPDPATNEALVLRWYDEFANGGKLALADELFAPDHVQYAPGLPLPDSGPAEQRQGLLELRTAFPDARFTVEDVVAEADRVVVRWTFRGTHRGEFWDLASTGERVAVVGTTVYRLADGRIAESWLTWDGLGLLLQLGAVAA
jgi:steroid delta-isomerase-like uncharacterized protein